MLHLYKIAGQTLKIIGGNLGNIPGFSLFQTDEKHSPIQPDLTIHLGFDVFCSTHRVIYQSESELFSLTFSSIINNDYLIELKQPNGMHWLAKICKESNTFVTHTNMQADTDSHLLRFAIWLIFGIVALHQQTVSIHASTVTYNNKSILFLGESGTGKSTQSRNWLKHKQEIELLNDDSPFVAFDENSQPIIYGSPWSGKTPCYKNKYTDIAAFIRLRQATHNSIRRLKTIESIAALQPSLPSIFANDPKLSELMAECISGILKKIPVYFLDCRPDEDAVNLVYETLKKDGWL